MKKLSILSFALFTVALIHAQDFTKNVATAKTSYTAGNLQDAHFALQQMMQDLDITVGKEVLKLLPAKMDTLPGVAKEDNVSGNTGFIGATIHRTYGTGVKKAELEIINNSPLVTSLNLMLTSPLMNSMASDGKTKTIKVQGYKARLTREDNTETNTVGYLLEIPFSSALVTFRINNSTEEEITKWSNTIPLAQIAKMIQ